MGNSSFIPPVQAGDRVQLASGGGPMTAERVYEAVDRPFAKCVWMDAKGNVRREPFDLVALKIMPWKDQEPT
ncbi:MAG TPA: DUF2158 domain-containing protein [Caulobacteraceae bacterium]|nr:DUF2158 domain-containing protein [Caulobacteraceae bacterium]